MIQAIWNQCVRLNLVASKVLLVVLLSTNLLCAETWIVTSPSDTLTKGTLRHAIVNAQNGDTIRLTGGLNQRPIILNNGEITISKDLTIEGLGRKGAVISSGKQSRVFRIAPNTTVRLENITLADGIAPFDPGLGGAIFSEGTLSLVSVKFLNNSASVRGGGIESRGKLVLVHRQVESTVS